MVLLFSLLYTSGTQAQTVNNSKFGKGLQFVAADSSFSLRFGTRFQLLYQGGQNPATNEWDDRFLIRRARLKFDGFAFSPRLEYKIELGLSNSDIGSDVPDVTNNADNIILDAVVKWHLTPNLQLWVGQTKLPGNRERVVSSQKLQFVDRSLLNSRFNLDRDAGLQLHHEHQLGQVVFREIGSISMGEGRDITVNNTGGYDYTGRFEILPFGAFEGGGDYVGSDIEREQTPKLALAASFDYNNNAAREQAQLGDFLSETRSLRTWFVDAIFKYRGFSAMAEYADRKATDGPVVLRDELGDVAETFVTGNALNLQAGYLLPSNWEVAGRYTDFVPTTETGIRQQDQYTLGVSKYIVGHSLKVQSDVTLTQEASREDYTQFRLQMELAL
ncbi:OprO/OprP family phosphate-selective porin [Pontibacter sp. HSC-14F20]|nr:porin [Pontibacter sp. HSC-14F20]MBX0333456.1 OprO/OprP family phosphate-selective porin [Pontibacter sp. HSC-14F20]